MARRRGPCSLCIVFFSSSEKYGLVCVKGLSVLLNRVKSESFSAGGDGILVSTAFIPCNCTNIHCLREGHMADISVPSVGETPFPQANAGVPSLRLRGVSKSFGAVRALTDVDFDVYPGE